MFLKCASIIRCTPSGNMPCKGSDNGGSRLERRTFVGTETLRWTKFMLKGESSGEIVHTSKFTGQVVRRGWTMIHKMGKGGQGFCMGINAESISNEM